MPRNARPGEVAGVGDRALLRTEETGEREAIRHTGRVIKILDRAKQRVLGIFRALPNGGGRLEPIDKKQLGRELSIRAGDDAEAQDGDLVAVEVSRAARSACPQGERPEAARLAQDRKRGRASSRSTPTNPIALQARSTRRGRGGAAGRLARPRGLARHAARHHRSARRQGSRRRGLCASPTPIPNNPGGFILTVAIADVALYVRPGSALDREALARGNSVYFPDRVVPMLPERISNDLCSLRPNENRRRSRSAW